MQGLNNSSSFVQFAVRAILWSINLLIVVFSLPLLVFLKIRESIFGKPKAVITPREDDSKSASYVPCGINPKM